MRILQNKGTFAILAYTPKMEKVIERCGRVAYRSEDKITDDSTESFIKMIIKRGHESVLEHGSITVLFQNHSRGFTHEMVRHRLCAFTQESTRYVDQSNFNFVWPPDLEKAWAIEKELKYYRDLYIALIDEKVPKQDARQFLPIGITSDIAVTTNVREWRHIFDTRCAKGAHWEIKRTMLNLLEDFYQYWPVLFEDKYVKFCNQPTIGE